MSSESTKPPQPHPSGSTDTFVQMPEDSINTKDYYELLGIDRSADAETIRKSYRKMALKHHPDKNGNTDEAVVLFQSIQKAHETLSDPKKRQIYDKYGEKGVQMMDSVHMYAPFIDPDMILAIHWFLLGATLAVTLLILFTSFLVTKVDGRLSWSWMAVFAPLYILDALLIGLIASTPVATDAQMKVDPDQEVSDEEKRNVRFMAILIKSAIVLVLVLFSLFQVFIASRLDGLIDWSWFKVASPWLALEGVNLLFVISSVVPQVLRGQVYDIGNGTAEPQLRNMTAYERLSAFVSGFLNPGLRLAQIILILLKLDGSSMSWGVVFVPTWIWGVKRILTLILSYVSLNVTQSDPHFQERKALWIAQLVLFLFGGAMVFITLGLIVRRLSVEDGYPPASVILIPIFISLSLLFCCFCCVLPMGIAGAQASLEEELTKGSSTSTPVSGSKRITSA